MQAGMLLRVKLISNRCHIFEMLYVTFDATKESIKSAQAVISLILEVWRPEACKRSSTRHRGPRFSQVYKGEADEMAAASGTIPPRLYHNKR